IGRTSRAGAIGLAVPFVCAVEAPQLAAIEALIRQTPPREAAPGLADEHGVPQTSATGQIIKKPKKPKQPKVPQAAPGATQPLSKKPRPQGGEHKPKPAAQRTVAAGKGASLSSGNPFSVQKPRSKPAGKPAAVSRKPAGKTAGGRGKRQP
ncbi:ATP-dependent helicase, partial [Burkholderia thailandensis]|nr:ATP-dependent helicase [Burkholderia thailandensis]